MLQKNPEARLSALHALEHPWFNEAMNEDNDMGREKLHAALDNFKKFNSGNRVKQAALGFMI